MESKCECGGTKVLQIPSQADPIHPNQYDYHCYRCGKNGIGWMAQTPVELLIPKLNDILAVDTYDDE